MNTYWEVFTPAPEFKPHHTQFTPHHTQLNLHEHQAVRVVAMLLCKLLHPRPRRTLHRFIEELVLWNLILIARPRCGDLEDPAGEREQRAGEGEEEAMGEGDARARADDALCAAGGLAGTAHGAVALDERLVALPAHEGVPARHVHSVHRPAHQPTTHMVY
jgi:hypothetical protein